MSTETDLSQIGPILVIASSLIFAIRTAKWPRAADKPGQPEWEAEVELSVRVAHGILFHLLAKSPFLFPQKYAPLDLPRENHSPRTDTIPRQN